jgi:hypothetical protein
VRVINHAHMLGFLDPNLPKRGQHLADQPTQVAS